MTKPTKNNRNSDQTCRFGKECKVEECSYIHEQKKPPIFQQNKTYRNSDQTCRFGKECKVENCPYTHRIIKNQSTQ